MKDTIAQTRMAVGFNSVIRVLPDVDYGQFRDSLFALWECPNSLANCRLLEKAVTIFHREVLDNYGFTYFHIVRTWRI
jgi:hypothetical protein